MSNPASSVFNLRVVGYVHVVSATLLGYEWAMLLDQEVSMIWNSPWNLSKVLYLLSRYTPVLDMTLSIKQKLTQNGYSESAFKTCHATFDVVTVSMGVGLATSELILIFRTYALYANSKKILSSLGSLWTIWVSVNIWILVKWMDSLVFAKPPSPLIPGCYIVHADPIVFVSFASLLFLETVIVLLTVRKALQLTRQSESPLLFTLFRDGIIFYLCLLPLSLGAVLALLLAPTEMVDFLGIFLRIIHSILCCRLLLRIRTSVADHSTQYSTHFDRLHTSHILQGMVFEAGVINSQSTDTEEGVDMEELHHSTHIADHGQIEVVARL